MGTLLYPELLNKSRYRKFLHGAFPWIGHVGIIHMHMSSLIGAAKRNSYGKIEFDHRQWTDNIWIRLLISRNVDNLMTNLGDFVHSLIVFAKPEMKITDFEWGNGFMEHRQFIGTLSVAFTGPGEQSFDLIVYVKLKIRRHRKRAVPIMSKAVKLELWFEKHSNFQVQS
jgi:hypothetical protein